MKPAIVILSAATGYGGGERSLETLLPLFASDYEVHLIGQNVRHVDFCLRLAAHNPSIHVSTLPHWPRSLQLVLGVVWLIHAWIRHRPYFLLANNNKSAMLTALASFVSPKIAQRTILYVRDFEWNQRHFIFRVLARALFLIPTETLLDRADYLSPWVAPRGNAVCKVVMNAVSLSTNEELAIRPQNADARPYVLLLATVQEWKGHEYVVRALTETPPHLRALFVGDIMDPEYQKKVLQLAGALKVADRIEFRAFAPDISAVTADCLCIVVASVAYAGGPETFGRTVIEGWAAAKPVLAFAVGGPAYLIENRVNGILVPAEDWRSLGRAMSELVDDPAFAERLGRTGRETARERHSATRIYAEFKAVAEPFLGGRHQVRDS